MTDEELVEGEGEDDRWDEKEGIDDTVPSCVVALDFGSSDTDGAKYNVGAFAGSGETDGDGDIDGNDDVIDALFVSFVETNDGLGDTIYLNRLYLTRTHLYQMS